MQSWSRMDFGTGKIIFLDITQKEDMLQVEYPNGFLLDMGWYQDRYIISIIQNFDWTQAVDGGGSPCGKGITVCRSKLKEVLL